MVNGLLNYLLKKAEFMLTNIIKQIYLYIHEWNMQGFEKENWLNLKKKLAFSFLIG